MGRPRALPRRQASSLQHEMAASYAAPRSRNTRSRSRERRQGKEREKGRRGRTRRRVGEKGEARSRSLTRSSLPRTRVLDQPLLSSQSRNQKAKARRLGWESSGLVQLVHASPSSSQPEVAAPYARLRPTSYRNLATRKHRREE